MGRRTRAWNPARLLEEPALACYLAFLVTLPLARLVVFEVGSTPVQLSDVFMGAAYLGWAIKWRPHGASIKPDRIFLAACVFLAALGVSLVGAADASKGLMKLVAYAGMVLLPTLSPRLFFDERRLAWAVRAWLAGAATAVGVGLLTVVAFYADRSGLGGTLMCGYGTLPSLSVPRVCAPFRNPNMFASYLVATLPLLLVWSPLSKRPALRLLALGATTLVAMLTLSAGFGGYLIAGAVFVWLARRRADQPIRWRDRGLAATAVGAAIFFFAASNVALTPPGEGNVSMGRFDMRVSDGARLAIWKSAFATFVSHPLTGKGYGSLVAQSTDPRIALAFEKHRGIKGPIDPVDLEAHNLWLSVAGQSGAIGLAAFLILVYAVIRGVLRSPSSAGSELGDLRAAMFAAFTGCVLYHGIFGALEESRHVWAMLGLLVTAGVHARGAPRTEAVADPAADVRRRRPWEPGLRSVESGAPHSRP